MSTRVKAIDKRTVHQICSGQVVLSLATAVKELVENSLDAGASSIEIRLKDHGSELIEVSDNGCGVAPENFEALTLKHHTSKLSDFHDLMTVSTFGFRGEALSSLCALSNLEVTTRQSSQLVATRIEYDSNGHIRSKVSCAREVGTTVSLHHLFHSLPVRHKEFQRNLKKEFSRMVQLLQGYCLICTGIRITCHNQVGKGKKQLVLSTSGGSSLTENIVSVFGHKQLQVLVEVTQCEVEEVEKEEEIEKVSMDTLRLFKLSGYVSKCCHGYGRSTTDRQYFFFNGRPCDHPKLSKAVNEVYHMYNRHQYPFILLNITTARDNIDVNITPDKRQLILHQEKALLLLVKASLRKLYQPMQGEYEASSVGHVATGDSQENEGSPPPLSLWKLSSLKRSFSYGSTGVEDRRQREPIPKQPKLSKYGIKSYPECPQPMTQEWEPDSSTEQINDDEAFSHTSKTGKTGTTASPPTGQNQSDHKFPHETNQAELLPSNHNSKKSHGVCDATGGDDIIHLGEITGTSPSLQQSPPATNGGGKDMGAVESHDSKERHTCIPGMQVTLDGVQDDSYKKREQLCHSLSCDLPTISERLKGASDRRKKEREKEGEAGCRRFRAKIRPDANSVAEEELKREISKQMFSKMRIVGQFNLGFIITKLGSDVFIIDQHATDEKFNFERLQRETVIQNQRLLQPKPLDLTTVSESVVMDNIDIFRMNGFHFKVDPTAPPTRRVRLTAKPVSKAWEFGTEDIDELIFLLSDSPGEMVRPSKVRQMFASRACRGSVMIGKALNTMEMKRLVSNMSVLDQPWNCPHGRPTMRHLIDLSRL